MSEVEGDPGLRLLLRVGVGGLLITAIVTGLVAIAAGADSPRTAFVMVLLGIALTSASVSLVGVVTLLRDQIRDEPISRGRIALVVGSFFGTTLLLAMAIGVASSAGAT